MKAVASEVAVGFLHGRFLEDAQRRGSPSSFQMKVWLSALGLVGLPVGDHFI